MLLYDANKKKLTTHKGTVHEGVYCGTILHPMLKELALFKDGDLTLQEIFTQVLLYSRGESELNNKFKK